VGEGSLKKEVSFRGILPNSFIMEGPRLGDSRGFKRDSSSFPRRIQNDGLTHKYLHDINMPLIGDTADPGLLIFRVQDSMPVAGRLHPAIYRSTDNTHIEGLAGALAAVLTHTFSAELLLLPPYHGRPGMKTVMSQLIVLGHISGMLPGDIVQEPDSQQGVQAVPVPDIVNLLRQAPFIDPVHNKHRYVPLDYVAILQWKFAQYTLSSPSSQARRPKNLCQASRPRPYTIVPRHEGTRKTCPYMDSGLRRNDGYELPLSPSLTKRGKRRSHRRRSRRGAGFLLPG